MTILKLEIQLSDNLNYYDIRKNMIIHDKLIIMIASSH